MGPGAPIKPHGSPSNLAVSPQHSTVFSSPWTHGSKLKPCRIIMDHPLNLGDFTEFTFSGWSHFFFEGAKLGNPTVSKNQRRSRFSVRCYHLSGRNPHFSQHFSCCKSPFFYPPSHWATARRSLWWSCAVGHFMARAPTHPSPARLPSLKSLSLLGRRGKSKAIVDSSVTFLNLPGLVNKQFANLNMAQSKKLIYPLIAWWFSRVFC